MTKEELDKEIAKQEKEIVKLRKKYDKAVQEIHNYKSRTGYKKRVRNVNKACYKLGLAIDKKDMLRWAYLKERWGG